MNGFYGTKIVNYILAEDANLSKDQIQEVKKQLNEKYSDKLSKIVKTCINSCMSRKSKYSNTKCNFVVYDRYRNSFKTFIGFDNYAYGNGSNTEEKFKLLDEFSSDLKKLQAQVQSKVGNDFKVSLFDQDLFCGLEEYIKTIKNIIEKEHHTPSNCIDLVIETNPDTIKNYIMSQSSIDEGKNKKIFELFDKFVEFIKNPKKMSSGFNSSHLFDICKICNISSEKLNTSIAKNIKTGQKYNFGNFDDPDFTKHVKSELGNCYIIDDISPEDKLLWSTKKKCLYEINYEHNECNKFYDKFEYNSKELEDYVFDNKKKEELYKKFKEYDKSGLLK